MRLHLYCLLPLAVAAAACGVASPPPAPLQPPDLARARFEAFSASRAWADLEALREIGPRVAGTRGARAARDYLRKALEAAGAKPEEVVTRVELEGLPPFDLTHVVAELPGDSPQRFVLVAPYDSSRIDGIAYAGVNDGASGAALVLELARVFAAHPLPYTTQVIFLDGEGRLGRGGPALADRRELGSRALAAQMDEAGALAGIRLLVSFNRVCDADLHIARDLGSHRIYREEFWKAASRLGYTKAFRPGDTFQSLMASHVAFRDRGVRASLAIEDTALGGDEPSGVYDDSAEDDLGHCSIESLKTVGLVSLAALDRIADRLVKIDRFARSPLLPAEAQSRTADAPDDARPDDAAAADDVHKQRKAGVPSSPASSGPF
jgi:Peptidase family M28